MPQFAILEMCVMLKGKTSEKYLSFWKTEMSFLAATILNNFVLSDNFFNLWYVH